MNWWAIINKLFDWPSLLIFFSFILLVIVIFKFPRQVGGVIERLRGFKFKKGDTEIYSELSESSTPITARAISEEQPSLSLPLPEKVETLPILGQKSSDDLYKEMAAAFDSQNMEEGEKVYKRLQDAITDPQEKIVTEVIYYSFRYECGDSKSLKKLVEFTKRPEVSSFTHYLIGNSYLKAGEFEKAAGAFESSALTLKGRASERAGRIVTVGQCLLKSKKKDEAFGRLMQEIGKETDFEAIAILYEGLAALYELSEDQELRALALEKALEIRLSDQNLRFRAAYAYSHKDFEALALLHYKTLLEFNPKEATSLNNIAILYDSLKMPISSVNYYKKSFDLNETLAAANLSYRLMDAGFIDEASRYLEQAKQQINPHPNVGRAIAAISDKIESENKTESNTLEVAREQQRYFLFFAEAYFSQKPDSPHFSGSWSFSNGVKVAITQNGSQINASWFTKTEEFKFEGIISNRAAKISTSKRKIEDPKTAEEKKKQNPWGATLWGFGNWFTEVSKGYIYISLDGKHLKMMNFEGSKHSFSPLVMVQ
jgi:Flp pilus assembly protein TadD